MAKTGDQTASRIEWLLFAALMLLFVASVTLMGFGIFPSTMGVLISVASFGALALALRRRTRLGIRARHPVRDLVVSLAVGGTILGLLALILLAGD